ncbi:MAG: hypothetical protein K2K19_12390 [Acetatifactor sp.]|nr:hypothetical protein [Acetatifactor sp.]
MDKICFLDIDGVLNSQFWNDSHQREISEGKYIDVDKVKLLGLLIHNTGAKLVLHSGWRFWFDDKLKPLRAEAANLVRLLAEENLTLYDMTPDLTTEEIRVTKKFSLVKAKEILTWLEMHPDTDAWVMLDDLNLNHDIIAAHQVRTDADVGLMMEDIRAAEGILCR